MNASESPTAARRPASTGQSRTRQLVMIVDDAPIIREPIEATLNRAGYETVVASQGADAVALLQQNKPDLILLDLAMPVMDGLAFLRHLRAAERTKHIPVIMLTAIAEKPRVVQAMKLGISAYLLKSRFSLQELLELIGQHITDEPGQMRSKAIDAPRPDQSGAPTPMADASSSSSTAAPSSSTPIAAQQSDASCEEPQEDALHGLQRVELPPCMPENDPLEALKQLKPLVTRSAITERIASAEELKGLSPAVTQVLKLTGCSSCSIEQVAKTISQDHAIALKILKLANSAVYTRGEPVDSVQLAVSRIGLGQIRQTVLNLSVMDQFSVASSARSINFGQFWEHAIAVGLISSELTQHRNEKGVDTAFTMGLLHDVGRLFFADQLGDTYADVLRVADELQLPLEQVESRLLLYNHADIMDRVLHQWKFSKQLINPVVFHHLSAQDIRRNAPKQFEEVATLGLANRLAHAMMLGSSGNEVVYPTEDFCSILKIEPDVIRTICDTTREECDKIKFALLATSSTDNWDQLREVHRNALAAPFRPIFVTNAPEFDAYRIFCEELRPFADDNEPVAPNIGVIHFTGARDRVPLTEAYRKRESAEGVNDLPLLALSPGGKVLPDRSLLNGRSHASLSTPFKIGRFIDVCNQLFSSV